MIFWTVVTYWPLTELSIKRYTCVNKWKNSGNRWVLNKNITRTQTAWVSWRQDVKLRASGRQRATVEQPSQDEKEVLLWSEELGSICGSLSPSPTHLSHTTNINPFENKVWKIYFYKEVCSFIHWSLYIMFDYVSAYIYICMCMWLYNTVILILPQ